MVPSKKEKKRSSLQTSDLKGRLKFTYFNIPGRHIVYVFMWSNVSLCVCVCVCVCVSVCRGGGGGGGGRVAVVRYRALPVNVFLNYSIDFVYEYSRCLFFVFMLSIIAFVCLFLVDWFVISIVCYNYSL